MKGKCLGKVKTIEKDAYITKTPIEIARICTDRCPYPTDKCGVNGCDFFKAERQSLVNERKIKVRNMRPCSNGT